MKKCATVGRPSHKSEMPSVTDRMTAPQPSDPDIDVDATDCVSDGGGVIVYSSSEFRVEK